MSSFAPQTFQQREFWRADIGAAILLGLGTTRFRDNPHCAHEVGERVGAVLRTTCASTLCANYVHF